MAWTLVGDAVTLAAGGSPHTTSTSTILVADSFLRMFFVRAELEFPDLVPSGAPPLLDGGVNAIGYIDSDPSFEFPAVDTLYLTVVPSDKEAVPRWFPDGSLRSYTNIRYQDPHVLELPRGMGYLMLLAEYLSEEVWGRQVDDETTPDVNEALDPPLSASASNCASAILAYWSSQPDFGDGSVQGPVWVVGRSQPWPTPDAGDVVQAWLGVPASCVLTVADTEYLYVYFVVELSTFEGDAATNASLNPDEHDGVYVRRLFLRHVVEALGAAWVEADGSVDVASPPEGGVPLHHRDGLDWNEIQYDLATIQGTAALTGVGASSATIGAYVAGRALRQADDGPDPAAAPEGPRGRQPPLPGEGLDVPSVRDGYFDDGIPSVRDGPFDDVSDAASAPALYFELPSKDWTHEAAWDLSTDSHLLPGEDLGKVRVWVATGDPFPTGGDPARNNRGNTEFEDYYDGIQVVDPVPVASGGQLVLYFSANEALVGADTDIIGYGAWCAVAVPESATPTYGVDFAVYPVDLATDAGERNLVAVGSEDGVYDGMKTGYLDPDPVQLPDGTWAVATGRVVVDRDAHSVSVTGLVRIEGSASDGLPSASAPWS